jgi:molybdate transport system substrate-binding protein
MRNCHSIKLASLLGLALMLTWASSAWAAEIKVLAGGSTRGPLSELAVAFEKASGHKVVLRYGTTPEIIKMIATDGPFDVGVVPQEVLKDATAGLRFKSVASPVIARVGLAVAVRAGAAKPDISTPEALTQTLLKAKSIATIPASSTGVQLLQIFKELGISEQMQQKTAALAAPDDVVRLVASGEIELAVFLMQVVMAPGLDVLGPFPAKIQREIVFMGAIAADTKALDAAEAFIAFLRTPEAAALLKSKGMIPG